MLHNAATEPEVVEFALFLKRMGAIAPTQAGPPMLPPRLVRRLVLAPMVIVIALGVIVLSPCWACSRCCSGWWSGQDRLPSGEVIACGPRGTGG